MSTSRIAPRLLLLHVPGADWQLAQSLADEDRLPHLNALIERGTIGNLMTGGPRARPALSATLSTGTRADRHGILAYIKPDLTSSVGIRPVRSTDLRALPIWEIVAGAGLKAAAIGWPASHPATVFSATVISDAFAEAHGNSFDDWQVNTAAVSDQALASSLAEFRLHPSEVTAEMVLPFLAEASQIDQETDERLAFLVATIARAASIHGAATWIAEHQKWNLLAVHFDLLERLTSTFLQYRAPRMAHVTETDHANYKDTVDGAYQFFDMLLGRYLELIGPDCHILLASSHGYLMDALRPPPSPAYIGDRLSPTYRELGLIAAAGPGIKRDELVFGARIYDVAPTALSIMGLPISREVEGRVLTDFFENSVAPTEVDHFPVPDYSVLAANEYVELDLRRLVEHATLGYHAFPPNDPELAHEQAEIRWLANLAKAFIVKADFAAALQQLNKLSELAPDSLTRLQLSAHCHLALGDIDACRAVLSDLESAGCDGPLIRYFRAKIALADGDTVTAQLHLDQAEMSDLRGVVAQRLLERIGQTQVFAKELVKAERAFRKALDIDPNSTLAHNGLGTALLGQGRPSDAADHFRRSLANHYQQAEVHCDLGHCMFSLGRFDEAAASYRQCLKTRPDLSVAKQALKKTENAIAHQAARKMTQEWSNDKPRNE